MIYNPEYNRWFTKSGLVFKYDESKDKLILCNGSISKQGYLKSTSSVKSGFLIHRAIWETFNGKIPAGMHIDHINGDKQDNRLENLRAVTPKENCNNPITLKKLRENTIIAGLKRRGKIKREPKGFGKKFFEHFGITRPDDVKLYNREFNYYLYHGKCRWEV